MEIEAPEREFMVPTW